MLWKFLRRFVKPPTDSKLDALIVPPRYHSRIGGEDFRAFDPALRERTARRREAAGAIRARAARVETGERTSSEILRGVRRA